MIIQMLTMVVWNNCDLLNISRLQQNLLVSRRLIKLIDGIYAV